MLSAPTMTAQRHFGFDIHGTNPPFQASCHRPRKINGSIGINSDNDGTTAGKIRFAPGIALFRLIGGLLARSGLEFLPRGPRPPERVVVSRYSGLAIEGFDPVAYFTGSAWPPGAWAISKATQPAPSGVSATRATAPRFVGASRDLRPPVRRLRPGRSGARVTYAGNPRVLAGLRIAALSVRPRGKPRRLRWPSLRVS